MSDASWREAASLAEQDMTRVVRKALVSLPYWVGKWEASCGLWNVHWSVRWRASNNAPRHLCPVLWKIEYALELALAHCCIPHTKRKDVCWRHHIRQEQNPCLYLPQLLRWLWAELRYMSIEVIVWQGSVMRKEAQVKALLVHGLDLTKCIGMQMSKSAISAVLQTPTRSLSANEPFFNLRAGWSPHSHCPITIISCDFAVDFKGLFQTEGILACSWASPPPWKDMVCQGLNGNTKSFVAWCITVTLHGLHKELWCSN